MRKYPVRKKKCSKCGRTKPFTLFYIDQQKSDGLRPNCRDCHRMEWIKNREKILIGARARSKICYRENREKKLLRAKERYRELVRKLYEQLGTKCSLCGEADRMVLQIDHIDGGGSLDRKLKPAGIGCYTRMLENLEEGRKMYRILCANCNLREAIIRGHKKSIWKDKN